MKHIFDEKRNENKIDEFSCKSHFKSFAMSRQIKENYLEKIVDQKFSGMRRVSETNLHIG